MSRFTQHFQQFADENAGRTPRLLLVLAALLVVVTYVTPLWTLTMFAPQYPEGLRLQIYSWKLEGGNKGQDVKEINVLNHYIGMKDLKTEDFDEFQWMPLVLGGLALLFLRAATFGKGGNVLDVTALFGYFALYSGWVFVYKLWSYGHSLSPTAAVKVEPFMPPVFGGKQLANFEVYSYPGPASYALGGVAACLGLSLLLTWRAWPGPQPRPAGG